jgi:hypothetical protein
MEWEQEKNHKKLKEIKAQIDQNLFSLSDKSKKYKSRQTGKHFSWLIKSIAKAAVFWSVVIGGTVLYNMHDEVYSPYGSDSNYTQLRVHEDSVVPLSLGKTALSASIQENDLNRLKIVLKNNPNLINQPTEFGVLPVTLAVLYNHTDMVSWLLDNGADFNKIRNENLQGIIKNDDNQKIENILFYNPINNYGIYGIAAGLDDEKNVLASRELLIDKGVFDYKANNYQLVKELTDQPGDQWKSYWLNKFTEDGNRAEYTNLMEKRYPEIASYDADLKKLDNLIQKNNK